MSVPKTLTPVPRGPGRPVAPASKPLSVHVPQSYHDKLARAALERDVSVSSLVRQILILRLSDPPS